MAVIRQNFVALALCESDTRPRTTRYLSPPGDPLRNAPVPRTSPSNRGHRRAV